MFRRMTCSGDAQARQTVSIGALAVDRIVTYGIFAQSCAQTKGRQFQCCHKSRMTRLRADDTWGEDNQDCRRFDTAKYGHMRSGRRLKSQDMQGSLDALGPHASSNVRIRP